MTERMSRSRQQIKKVPAVSIEGVVALFLETKATHCTTLQCMNELLQEVRKTTGNYKLTIKNIKECLRKWFEEGWAELSGGFLRITRIGRSKIRAIATAFVTPIPA